MALRVVSADDHMDLFTLPPDLWQERLPARYREQGPRVVDGPEGKVWQAEGRVWGPSGRKAAGLVERYQYGLRPGDPVKRLEDMDVDGVHAHVIYANPTGFPCTDPELKIAVIQAYNDWAADFNRHNPNRLCALAFLPAHDPAVAAAELRRVAARGIRGAQIRRFETPHPTFAPAWEPLWSAAEETGLPVSIHIGGGEHSLHSSPRSWSMAATVGIDPMQLDEDLAGLILSGMLERHPRLTVIMAESGLGWVPYVVQRLDQTFHKYYDLITDYRIQTPPSEQFARQVYVTYEEDPIGVRLIPDIGAGNVMWASDYPHGDSTWPHSLDVIERSLGHLSDADRRKVVSENAAALYGLSE